RVAARHLGIERLISEPLIGAEPHPWRLFRKRFVCARFSTEALPDFAGAPESPLPRVLALAGISKAIAMAAEKIAAGAVQLSAPPPACDAIHDARADEVRTAAAKPAGHLDDAHSLRDVFPVATVNLDAVRKANAVGLRLEADPSNTLVLTHPSQAARPAQL